MPVIRFYFHFDPAIGSGNYLTALYLLLHQGLYSISGKNVDRETAFLTGYSGVGVISIRIFGYIKVTVHII
jgi:hypothetical protein